MSHNYSNLPSRCHRQALLLFQMWQCGILFCALRDPRIQSLAPDSPHETYYVTLERTHQSDLESGMKRETKKLRKPKTKMMCFPKQVENPARWNLITCSVFQSADHQKCCPNQGIRICIRINGDLSPSTVSDLKLCLDNFLHLLDLTQKQRKNCFWSLRRTFGVCHANHFPSCKCDHLSSSWTSDPSKSVQAEAWLDHFFLSSAFSYHFDHFYQHVRYMYVTYTV